jgi:ABC-2 family transporter protein
MRWRVLMNSLERTSARDKVERLSLALEQIGPLIAMALVIPSMFIVAGQGVYAGFRLASTQPTIILTILRLLLAAASVLCLVGPLMLPSMERTTAVRLLLLPIPRRTLYITQLASTVSDPWIMLAIPAVIGLPLGLAIGGAFGAAAIGVVASVLFLATLVGLSAIASIVLSLIFRDRRRGELIALVFVVLIPVVSSLPGLLFATAGNFDREGWHRPAQAERAARRDQPPPRSVQVARRAIAYVPSELLVSAMRSTAQRDVRSAGLSLLALGVFVIALHGTCVVIFGRLLDSPASGTAGRTRGSAEVWTARLPGLSRGAAAVAQAHLRLAMRTNRGRSMLISPLIVFPILTIVARRLGGAEAGIPLISDGLGLAAFGSGVALLSVLPFAMNQFAIDRAGLTMEFLLPLSTEEILIGKFIGSGIIAFAPAVVCMLVAFAFFPHGSLALWLCLPLAFIATYLLVAPLAAALSAVFPRAVNLNSIGNASNAHGIAGVAGLAAFAAAGGVPALMVFMSAVLLRRPLLALALIVAWCGIALILSRLSLPLVVAIFDKRRENLGLIAGRS